MLRTSSFPRSSCKIYLLCSCLFRFRVWVMCTLNRSLLILLPTASTALVRLSHPLMNGVITVGLLTSPCTSCVRAVEALEKHFGSRHPPVFWSWALLVVARLFFTDSLLLRGVARWIRRHERRWCAISRRDS